METIKTIRLCAIWFLNGVLATMIAYLLMGGL